MPKDQPTYQFIRKLTSIKNIVSEDYLNDTRSKTNLLESLRSIQSVKNLFSRETRFNIGNNTWPTSVNLEKFKVQNTHINQNRFSSRLFPSDFVKILTDFATIFSEVDKTLTTYGSGLSLVKEWGFFTNKSGNKDKTIIDEVLFLEHMDDIQQLLNIIISVHSTNPKFVSNKDDKNEDKDESEASGSGRKKSEQEEEDDDKSEGTDESEDENQKEPEKEDTQTRQKQKSAVVPPVTPDTTPPLSQPKGSPKPLTPHQREGLALKEIAKLHSQAIGRMFGAYGIDMSQDKSIISTNLLAEITNHFYSLPPQDQAKFITLSSLGRSITVGKNALRGKFLSKVYEKFRDNAANEAPLAAIYKEIQENPQKFKGLEGKNLADFKQFHSSFISKNGEVANIILRGKDIGTVKKQTSPEQQLESSLEKILSKDKKEINNTNIENAIETMIFRNEDKDGVSLELNKMEATELAELFGISSIESMDNAELDNFKEVLAAYSARKTIELAISTGRPELLGHRKTKKAVSGENKLRTKHLSFASVASSTKEHGAETTENALDYNRKDRKKEVEKIAKQYKSFFGLWENLSAKEQRQVYNKFNIAYDKNMDKDRKLMFVPEFLFFDVGSLKSFGNSITTEQKATYDEFLEANQTYLKQVGDQMVAEEQYGQFLRDSYLFYTQEHQTLLIADYLASQNEGIELTGYPDEAFFDNFSASEIANADQYIQDPSNNYALSNNGQSFSKKNNLMNRFGNSKWGKKLGLGNTNSPSSKMNKALKSKLKKGLTSAINKLPPSVWTTALKTASKLFTDKNFRMFIAGTLGALLGGLIYLLGRFPGLLKSMFGLGGSSGVGEMGAVANATGPGTAITGSEVLNAENSLGAAQKPANTSANLAEAQAAQVAATKAVTIAQASGVFFGLPIAFLAPGIAMFVGLIVTMHTIFTIQSAFLVPTPPGLDGSWGGGPGGGGPLNCSDTNNLNIVTEPSSGIASIAYGIVEKLEQGFWCYWNRHPEKPEYFDEAEYQAYPNHCVYDDSTPDDCGGDFKKLYPETALYWCTWLVRHAYGETSFSAGAQGMANQFGKKPDEKKPGYSYQDIEGLHYSKIKPGDAFFLYTSIEVPGDPDTSNHIGHVAIVASVSQDSIITVDSNSYYKANSYTVGGDGFVQVDSVGGLWVAGIGYKNSNH